MEAYDSLGIEGAVATSFDSRQLQDEIEHLKQMRQNYGTDWLLSTPNLIVKNIQDSDAETTSSSSLPTKDPRTANSGGFAAGLSEAGVVESFAVYRSIEFSILGMNLGGDGGRKKGGARPRRRSPPRDKDDEEEVDTEEEDPAEVVDEEGKSMCILSVTEKCLVEKDETNTDVHCINELAALNEIRISIAKLRYVLDIKQVEVFFSSDLGGYNADKNITS